YTFARYSGMPAPISAPINPPVAPPAPAPASAAAIGPAMTRLMPGRNSVVPTAAMAARTAPTAPPTALPIPRPSAACVRVCRANSLDRVASDMSTLMSSRLNPRFKSASTADSAAILLLKRAVTKVAFSLAILSSNRQFYLRVHLATHVPATDRAVLLGYRWDRSFVVFRFRTE